MHELDAVFLEEGNESVTGAEWYGGSLKPMLVDIKLKGDQNTFELGARKINAIHVPGHSPGSLVYVMESEGLKVLWSRMFMVPSIPACFRTEGTHIPDPQTHDFPSS
jgi:glyoxylase-like metal-dependent hydrolase (beta-lactamase superfamily II)